MTRHLIIEADGGSRGNPGVAGFGALVREGVGGPVLAERAAYLGESVTNNVAEYSGLIAGIRAALEIDPSAAIDVRMDSKLVISQMSGKWKINHADMRALAAEAKALLKGVKTTFTWVPRKDNSLADKLANEVMDSKGTVSRNPGAAGAALGPVTPGLPAPVTPGLTRGPVRAADPERSSGQASPGAAGAALGPGSPLRSVRGDGGAGPSSAALKEAVEAAQAALSGTQRHLGASEAPTTVVLVRHGMTEGTARDVYAGSIEPGPDLSELGRLQAQAAANELVRMIEVPWAGLERPTTLYSSPMARCLQTAAPLSDALGLRIHPAPEFAEEDFGRWDTLTKAEVEKQWPGGVRRWFVDPDYKPGGAESRAEVGERVRAALDALVAAHRGETVAVVAHTMVIRAALGAALGAPPQSWFAFRVAPASITALRFWGLGQTEVMCTSRTVA